MENKIMTSLERVLTTLGHKEPDRVPFFLLLTMHGAKELNISIKEYFSNPEYVVEGQLRLREKYKHDCYYSFFYASVEIEAFGGEVIYTDDGPPNSGKPVIDNVNMIKSLKIPRIENCQSLTKVLRTQSLLKEKVKDDAPVIGTVISPFSLPIMQLGFDNYLDLMYENKSAFNDLMEINKEFCINWANAQLDAGATAICYFDPVSSPDIVPRELYLKTGFKLAKETISKINGPTATHLGSGRAKPIIHDLVETGTYMIGTSINEDLSEFKKICSNKLTILGNLDGIKMRNWGKEEAELQVKSAIFKAGKGGGFILSDNHGEIPFQVQDATLLAISDAVQKWGKYPLDWS